MSKAVYAGAHAWHNTGLSLARPYRRRRVTAPEPSRRRDPLFGSPGKVLLGAALCLAAGAMLERTLARPHPYSTARRLTATPPAAPHRPAHLTASPRLLDPTQKATHAARLLNGGALVLACSALADSGMEHDRSHFDNRAMYVAPIVSALTLAVSGRGIQAPRHRGPLARDSFLLAVLTGLAGLGFHTYNIGKRAGGFSLLNLFYAAPLGAPGAVSLAGVLGLAAQGLFPRPTRLAGRNLALVTAAGLLGTVAEAGLLHFRGAFQNPYMYLPVSLPPAAAAALTLAAWRPTHTRLRAARILVGATAVLGVAGTMFHAYGIHRNMGGWRNWSQMLLQGPPLPAPPGFTGVALGGLGALHLLEIAR